MKTKSNIPLPTEPQRWKDGEFIIYNGHKDNGVQPVGMEGNRYEADFTIVRNLTAKDIVHAFTRMSNDPQLEQKVVDFIETNGGNALNVITDYPTKVSSSIFPALPTSGVALVKGQIFSYANGAVVVEQSHTRTIYPPEQTPALFSFYREITEGKEWIPQEQVAVNSTRTYQGVTYKCIQAHLTQDAWNPVATLGNLWAVVPAGTVWAVGVAYKVNDVVTYSGKSYKCLQAHTSQAGWTPTAVPALWKLI